ncbi:MAG TPA: hypothetical protein ENN81_12050 [Phycisphaerales bacterium]|nr:hypothetical protein [Phycisphaerales bacterium]
MVIAKLQFDAATAVPDECLDAVDALLESLDTDIKHLETSLRWLDELRVGVVKRDADAMSGLLERIRADAADYAQVEEQRRLLCGVIAQGMGCDPGTITLTRIEHGLTGPRKTAAAERKARLQTLAEHLRSRHLATAGLLADCARINGLLLNGIAGLSASSPLTYRSDGSTGRSGAGALMDISF